MRHVLISFLLLLIVVIICIPWVMMRGLDEAAPPDRPPDSPPEVKRDSSPPEEGEAPLTIEVALSGSGRVQPMGLEEYLVGVVAAEMPASFHPEALKAQAVLARTYAVSRLRELGGSGTAAGADADISDDPDYDQAWMNSEQMRDRWGWLSYWTHRRRIEEAVAATEGLVVTHDGSLIEAVYHSTSGGRTEDAISVWGGEHPYLVSVQSPYEEHSPHKLTARRLTWGELAGLTGVEEETLRAQGADPDGRAVRVAERSKTGRVVRAIIGGEEFCARRLRELLDLPSTWWEVEEHGDGVTFSVRGFGHGVGMSQYGADGMAQRGYSHREIITHYYPDTELHSLQELDAVAE